MGLDMNTRCTTRDPEATTSCFEAINEAAERERGAGGKLLCMPTDPSPVLL